MIGYLALALAGMAGGMYVEYRWSVAGWFAERWVAGVAGVTAVLAFGQDAVEWVRGLFS